LKFLFITSSNIACNPRLLKELQLAIQLGKICTVIQFKLGNWSDSKTNQLKKSLQNVRFIEFSALRTPFFNWLYTSLIEKALSFLPHKLLSIRLQVYSLSKRSLIINKFLKNHLDHYDWVVAHNPPTFYPALIFSSKIGSKFGLDIEDYHPGETNDLKQSRKMLRMMKAILPKADYCSFAAPLIQEEVQRYINHESKEWFTILNGFSGDEFIEPTKIKNEKLKLVWFSQNITPGRGLEKFISAVINFQKDIEFHLIGNITASNRILLLQNNQEISIHPPMSQKDLHQFLSQFDVGLATDPPLNKNRELAVTNKILAFAQAGLYIVSVKAFGQNDFLRRSNLNYSIVDYSVEDISVCLRDLVEFNKTQNFDKQLQYEISQKYSWENTNKPLIKVWGN
jgi:hypothetical protein